MNLPEVQVANDGTSRITHLHRSVPGVLAEIVTILGEADANILGQQLATRGEIGYAVIDVESSLAESTVEKLAALPSTIRLRSL